jgi:hypothetical protein
MRGVVEDEGGGGISVLSTLVAFFLGFGAVVIESISIIEFKYNLGIPFWFSDM